MTEPSSTPPDNDPENGPDQTRDDIQDQTPAVNPDEQETSIWGRADEQSAPSSDGTPSTDQSPYRETPYADTPYGTASYDTAVYGGTPYGQQYAQPGQPGQSGPYNQQVPPQGQGYPQGPQSPQGNPGYPGGPTPAGFPAGAPAYGMNPGYPGAQGYPGYPGPQGYPGYGVPQTSPKSKIAAALLAFFLGGFGAHNFYLGLKNRAIGQVATTVLSIILMIVGFAVMFAGFGDSYDSYDGTSGYYNTWDEDNGALIGTGLVLIVISSIAMCAVGIWAFVEFILILVGSGNYAHDREGRPLS